jgi:hypothetical protein
MKRFAGIASVLVLLAAPMFGSSKKPQNVVIPEKVQIGSTQLPAGNYKLAWTGDGPTVQATLSTKDGKTVVAFTATATQIKNSDIGVDVDTNGGVSSLKRILLNNLSLQIENAQ